MKKHSFKSSAIGALVFLVLPLVAQPSAMAAGKSKLSADNAQLLVGKWVLDLKESSLGTDPYEQFDAWTLSFTAATKDSVAWTADATIKGGKTLRFSWNGPTDGTQKPLVGIGGVDAYHWAGKKLIRDSDLGHGEIKRDFTTISPDGNTMIILDVSHSPAGVARAKLVLHRQS